MHSGGSSTAASIADAEDQKLAALTNNAHQVSTTKHHTESLKRDTSVNEFSLGQEPFRSNLCTIRGERGKLPTAASSWAFERAGKDIRSTFTLGNLHGPPKSDAKLPDRGVGGDQSWKDKDLGVGAVCYNHSRMAHSY